MIAFWDNSAKQAFRGWTRADIDRRKLIDDECRVLRNASLEGRLIALRTACSARMTGRAARDRMYLTKNEREALLDMLHGQEGRCSATGLALQYERGLPKQCMLSLAKIDQRGPRTLGNIVIVCGWASNIINLAGLPAYVEFVWAWGTRQRLPGCCALTGMPLNREKQTTAPGMFWNASWDRLDNGVASHDAWNVQLTSLWANMARGRLPIETFHVYMYNAFLNLQHFVSICNQNKGCLCY